MVRITILSVLFAFTTLGCTKGGGAGTCDSVDDCEDNDSCTADSCLGGTCDHQPITSDPDCAQACQDDSECDDGDECTADSCGGLSTCIYFDIVGCGVSCVDDTECDDGDFCTTDVCGVDETCGHAVIQSAACDSCDLDDVCAPEENCACYDCQDDNRCANPGACTEIVAPDVTGFNEGAAEGADGSDLEGAGLDIVQVFPSGSPAGVIDFTQIADHDDCFATGGCAQLRLNYDIAAIEGMFTTGTWQHNADGSGEIYGATAYEYTQGAGGVMNYVTDGKCWHADHIHHEP